MYSKKQIAYLRRYMTGTPMPEIAKEYGVTTSTVSRTIKRALRHTCPFSPDCRKCPLPECAIKDEYADLVNNTEDMACIDRRRTKRWTG